MASKDINTTANTNDNRNTSFLTEELYVEDHSMFIKCLSVIIGLVSLTLSILAITVLRRTRKIPKSTTYLVTALLVFDCMFVAFSTVQKFIQEPLLNTTINVLTLCSLLLAHTTVGIMSIERCLLFYMPMTYMRLYSERFILKVTAGVWITELCIFLCVRYAICYLRFKSVSVFSQAGLCNNIVIIYFIVILTLVLATSMVSYWIIFVIVRKKNSRKDERVMSFRSVVNLIRGYKNTVLVLVFWVLILVTIMAYVFIAILILSMGLSPYIVRLSRDAVSTLNCLLNPIMYVLWFKECKLELLKLFSCLGQSVKEKARLLQYELFDIVPYESTASDRSIPPRFEGNRGVDINNQSGFNNPAFYEETTL